MTLSPEQLLGSYRLIDRLGAGGMGEVWKAEDTRLGRMVAIKILPAQVAADHEAIARMKREARTAAQIYHSNIATIHSFEEAGDRMFIVMELVEGESLATWIRRGPISEAEVCRIGRGVAEALAEAHARGIVHRDIKPDNIMVTESRVKVLDFGIAKQVGPQNIGSDDPTEFITQQGIIIGTIQYMSPEQALGKQLDARTDIFSLGVVLYEAATGKLPFRGETPTDTITRIIRDEAKEPRQVNPALSPGLSAIIKRCLRKNRDDRFANAGEIAVALEKQMVIAATAPTVAVSPTEVTSRRGPITTSQPLTVREGIAAPGVKPFQWGLLVGALAIIVIGISGVVMLRSRKPTPPKPQPVEAAASGSVVTAAVTITAPEPSTVSTEAPAGPPAPHHAADFYAKGMEAVDSRDWPRAREAFEQAVKADPRDARAHLRLGELALLQRDMHIATEEFNRALDNSEQLDEREELLASLGLAIARGDRLESRRLGRLLHDMNPNDPDLERIRREYDPLMSGPPEERRPFERQPPPRRRPFRP